LEDWIQSPKYGNFSARQRRAVLKRYCEQHKLDEDIAFQFDDVDLFIDYGLITTESYEIFFESVREFAADI
jgi:hypothetical protein